jgi:hypothetical protein
LIGRETWCLDVRENMDLGLSENKVLRRIFGPKRNKVIGDQRKLHDKKLRNFYGLPRKFGTNKSRMM